MNSTTPTLFQLIDRDGKVHSTYDSSEAADHEATSLWWSKGLSFTVATTLKPTMKETADQIKETLDYSTIEIEDANQVDDYADAYVGFALHKDGTPLTEVELETLSEDTEFVYDIAWEDNH